MKSKTVHKNNIQCAVAVVEKNMRNLQKNEELYQLIVSKEKIFLLCSNFSSNHPKMCIKIY